ncbi:MepB family protein [Deinococcus sedimenti]|uniref:MepB family protein n=1 Tax=Deinococcus sedimenti TaxID=1867090 RepID=UPI001E4F1B66|nr:MepB family protein [Deinococcus sedimenti]
MYERAGLALSSPVIQEPESVEYGASTFGVGGRNVIFRVAKTTPTKLGQFVTLWKRNAMTAKIVPFDASDPVDGVVIHSACGGEQGQFIFDQKTMVERGVFSVSGQGGKRALRIYPPWSNPLSREAVKTQQWQQRSFVSLSEAGGVDSARLKELLG